MSNQTVIVALRRVLEATPPPPPASADPAEISSQVQEVFQARERALDYLRSVLEERAKNPSMDPRCKKDEEVNAILE